MSRLGWTMHVIVLFLEPNHSYKDMLNLYYIVVTSTDCDISLFSIGLCKIPSDPEWKETIHHLIEWCVLCDQLFNVINSCLPCP